MNTFIQIWRALNPAEKMELAERMQTSTAYLSQIANGHRNAGVHFKMALDGECEKLSKQAKPRREMGA